MRVWVCVNVLAVLLYAAGGDAAVPAPTNDPEDYRLIFSQPSVCERSQCTTFVAIQTNVNDSTYLDFYLEGAATSWVAVGVSATRDMFSADVLGCIVTVGGNPEVVDTYNVDDLPQPRNNVVDQTQNGTVTHSTNFTDGRIICSFSRTIAPWPEDIGRDLNLNGNYFVMYGGYSGILSSAGNLPFHTFAQIPTLSGETFNIVTDGASAATAVNPLCTDPAAVTVPTNDLEDYRLFIRQPRRCSRSSCDIYVAIQTNNETNNGSDVYLDFYIEGDAEVWVAFGVSNSENMFRADVLGCQRVPTDDSIVVVDTWNPGTRTNEVDETQDGIIMHSSGYIDGRITCSFSRLADICNVGVDLNLDDDYYVMWGRGDTLGDMPDPTDLPRFEMHEDIPEISDDRYNLARDSGDITAGRLRERLIRAHGVLMVVAWPVLALTGIFFAAWMRPALPNGEWFQVHRAFMLASLFVAVVGFVLVFVANRNQDPQGLINTDDNKELAHLVIGVIVLALHFINPIISICRCKPTGTYRWIFNVLHGTIIGLGAELLALVNVALGAYIFSDKWSVFEDETIFYVFLGFLIFFLILVFVLIGLFTILGFSHFEDVPAASRVPSVLQPVAKCLSEDSPKNEIELSSPGQVKAAPAPAGDSKERKPASKDAPFRWVALGIFLGVMVPMMIAIIVLIALEED